MSRFLIGGLASLAAVAAVVLGYVSLGTNVVTEAAEVVLVEATDPSPHPWTPGNLSVPVGTTVRWSVGSSAAPHTITSDGCGDAQFGACVFDSPRIQTGTAVTSFDYTFSQPGIYPFYCRLHGTPGGVGQTGSVVVYETAAKQPLGQLHASPSLLQPKASVGIQKPSSGQVIAGDKVTVDLSVIGASLRESQAGVTDPRFGHFHLVLDTDVDLGVEFPRAAPGVYHVFGDTFTLEGVRPGAHTLKVYWGFDNHFSPIQPILATVNFTTTAAGGGIAPPRTGDGGLASTTSLGAASFIAALVAGTGGLFIVLRRQVS